MISWALAPLLLLGCGLMARLEPPVQTGSLEFLPKTLPAEIGAWSGSPTWHCHNEQCMQTFTESQLKAEGTDPLSGADTNSVSPETWLTLTELEPRYRCPACGTGTLFSASLGEQRQLPGDTRLLRSRYERNGRGLFTVTLVISGRNRGSLHRPELCLPAQGFVMADIRSVEVEPDEGGLIAVKQVSLERAEGRSGQKTQIQFLYWFFNEDRQTASHLVRVFWTAWDRAFHHRATRWAMVTITADRPVGGNRETDELLSFAGELMRKMRP